MKSRLYHQQSELEAEQTNNALMLKEMQQLLSAERLEKEELKIRLQEVSWGLICTIKVLSSPQGACLTFFGWYRTSV